MRVPAEEYSKYMCDYQVENPDSTLFNLPVLYELPNSIDVLRLKSSFEEVCLAHPMLLSVFEKAEDGWDIVYCPEKSNPVEIVEESELDVGNIVIPFVLGESVYKCKIIIVNTHTYLFIDFFHGAIDGTGRNIFFKELGRAYEGEKLDKDEYFGLRKELEAIRKTEKYALDKAFLEEKYGKNEYSSILTPDSNTSGDYKICEFKVTEGVVYTNESSLRAVLYAMAEYNGSDKVMATWTYHSRDTEAKKEAIGLFIRDIPIGIKVGDNVKDFIKEGYAHMDYQWSLTNDVSVLYTTFQGKINELEEVPGIACKRIEIPKSYPQKADNPMDIEFIDDSKGRRFTIRYDSGIYRPESIEKFGKMVQSWYKKGSIN